MHLPVLFGSLQIGQRFTWLMIMLFLQRSQSAAPVRPQPLQEWGAIRSSRLGSVVVFTIFDMIFLILL